MSAAARRCPTCRDLFDEVRDAGDNLRHAKPFTHAHHAFGSVETALIGYLAKAADYRIHKAQCRQAAPRRPHPTGGHSVRTERDWTVEEFEAVAKELNPYYGQKFDDGHMAVECNCDGPYCQFCQGGLFACSVCGGLEGSVPTHCPGDAMTYKQSEDVYAGRIDYRDGAWVSGVTVAMVHTHVGAIIEGRA